MAIIPPVEEKIDDTVANLCKDISIDTCESNSVSSCSDTDENTIIINKMPNKPIIRAKISATFCNLLT